MKKYRRCPSVFTLGGVFHDDFMCQLNDDDHKNHETSGVNRYGWHYTMFWIEDVE